jgi:hypothetical protein
MADNNEVLYAQLVDMSDPAAVFTEVRHLAGLMDGAIDIERLAMVYDNICNLFRGDYPGYRSCNTLYHDLRHTTDVFLALSRLLHGAWATGIRFAPGELTLAMISTLMHDTGYIQQEGDLYGTGGKYTLTHVERSVIFMEEFFPRHGFSVAEIALCESFVLGTSISVEIDQARFATPSALLIGRMIGSADLLGQLADRIYLEKLLFLFREFREANVVGYNSELELLTSTVGFYGLMEKRLVESLANVRQYMRHHFRARWGIDSDLYQRAIDHNLYYLRRLLEQHRDDYRSSLKREGLVAKLQAMEAAEKGAVAD